MDCLRSSFGGPRSILGTFVLLAAAGAAGCDHGPRSSPGLDERMPAVLGYRAQPSPSGPTARTGREDERQRAAWGRRNVLAAYDRVGLRDPRWDRGARRFLEAGLPSILVLPGEADPAGLVAQGKALLAAGCRDPVVLYVFARALAATTPDSLEPAVLLQEAVESVKSVSYPRAVARYVVSGLSREYQRSQENRGMRKDLAPLELEWFQKSLRDSYERGEDAVLAYQLSNGTGVSFMGRSKVEIVRSVEEASWTEPWLRRLVAGMSEVDLAFEARGHEYADKVMPEGWKRFYAHMAVARQHLHESWRLRPDRPEAAEKMIEVLLGGQTVPGDDVRLWFDRTVGAQMDYPSAYHAVFNHLRPRWGGSYEDLMAFGRECLDTGRFDTGVPKYLLEVVEQIEFDQKDEDEGKGHATIFRAPDTYPLLVRLFEGYLADASPEWKGPSLRSNYAVAADKAGHPADALRQLQALRFELDPSVSEKVNEPPVRFVTRIAAYGGPSGLEVLQAEKRVAEGRLEEARSTLREAARKDTSPQAARFFTHRLAALDLEVALAGGGWVPFLPRGSELPGWERLQGTWEALSDGGLRARPDAKGTMIRCTARVGPDFELRGEVQLGPGTDRGFQAGVVFGHPEFGKRGWLSFRPFRDRYASEGTLLAAQFTPAGVLAKLPIRETSSFRVLSRNGRVSAWVNEQPVATEWPPPKEHAVPPDAQVGFGGYRDNNDFTVTYRRVEVRLAASPGAP